MSEICSCLSENCKYLPRLDAAACAQLLFTVEKLSIFQSTQLFCANLNNLNSGIVVAMGRGLGKINSPASWTSLSFMTGESKKEESGGIKGKPCSSAAYFSLYLIQLLQVSKSERIFRKSINIWWNTNNIWYLVQHKFNITYRTVITNVNKTQNVSCHFTTKTTKYIPITEPI